MKADRLLSDPGFLRLKNHLIDRTGLSYFNDKDLDFAERISRRMGVAGIEDCREYLTALNAEETGEREFDQLAAELTIGETYFFRNDQHFIALRDVIARECADRCRTSGNIRIWSAGCSTGAEAYTISIVLNEFCDANDYGATFSIIGTDINRRSLAQAREGRYQEWALRGMSEERRNTYFTRDDDSWRIRPRYRKNVTFEYHNLVKTPIPSLLHGLAAFDIIFFRNVMIYFDSETRLRLMQQLARSLVDGGWLILGHAEMNLPPSDLLCLTEVNKTIVYRKTSADSPQRLPASTISFDAFAEPPAPESAAYRPPSVADIEVPEISDLAQPEPETSDPKAGVRALRRFADRGEWERAQAYCRQLRRLHPYEPMIFLYQAYIYEHLNQIEEAIKSLRNALYLDRGLVLAHYHLGLLMNRSGNARRAVKSFESVLKLLADLPPTEIIENDDGLTVADLRTLSEMQLDILKEN